MGIKYEEPKHKYLLGQRVILKNAEVGIIVTPERNDLPNTDTEVWVYSPSQGYASRYSINNIKKLPNGQL